MRYKIGDVARILGISPDLIRYYEERGIVTPAKDPANNYRYYDTWDINYLIDCLWYKNFGFGIDQIAHMASKCSFETLLDNLEEKSGEILAAITHQEMLLERIRKFCESLIKTKNYLGVCDLRENAEFVRYLNRRNFTYDNDAKVQRLSRKWLKYMPFTRRYFEIPVRGDSGSYAWGFSLGLQYVKRLGIEITPPIECVPSRLCIYSAFKSAEKDRNFAGNINFMYDYAKDNNLTVIGGAFGNLACSVLENDTVTGYFEAWLPVAKS